MNRFRGKYRKLARIHQIENKRGIPINVRDEYFMDVALQLGERGRGGVEPNPVVGAVIVKNDRIIGEGWHQHYGQAHAEIMALNDVVNRGIDSCSGSTLYVTLEPCCHYGKTPPCTDAIIQARIERVVVAIKDPFPQVAGKGIAKLLAHSILVDVGVCAEKAKRQNAPFFKRVTQKKTYVHAKWAMSLDGKIATSSGNSQWISSPDSREMVHQLREKMDAILVGAVTLITDDPLLTPRPKSPKFPNKKLARFVLTSGNRPLPINCKLMQTLDQGSVYFIVPKGNSIAEREIIQSKGGQILEIPSNNTGGVEIPILLRELAQLGITNLMVEGGAEVLGSFHDARSIDECHIFIAPKIIGGRQAYPAIGGVGNAFVSQSAVLEDSTFQRLENDIYCHGYLKFNSEKDSV